MSGKLYLVPTPLGNMEDITLRAINVLKSADIIFAEDTRKSGILLKHYEISNKLDSFHQHNEHQKLNYLVSLVNNGQNVAIITDAGTPGISDPGFLAVRACVEQGLDVECLPGATALIPALVNSGLPTDRFVFEGFLPHKKGRMKRIEELAGLNRTIVLYESPHRVHKCLTQLAEFFAPTETLVSISRELTKMFEETVRGSLEEMIHRFEEKTAKGEFVIVLSTAKNTSS